MKRPNESEIFEDELAEYWMENKDLLCSVCKPAIRTLESTKNAFELIEKITDGRKVCLLSDISSAGQGSAKVRELSIAGSVKHFNAMALITSSAFGALLGNMFMSLSRQPIPMKLFNNETEAREWVYSHIKSGSKARQT